VAAVTAASPAPRLVWYFPGNLLAFAVWIRPRMRHSSGCYLAAD